MKNLCHQVSGHGLNRCYVDELSVLGSSIYPALWQLRAQIPEKRYSEVHLSLQCFLAKILALNCSNSTDLGDAKCPVVLYRARSTKQHRLFNPTLRKGADNEVQPHNTSIVRWKNPLFFSSVQYNRRRDVCHQAALLIMEPSPFKWYNQVCPAAPWEADGTAVTQGPPALGPAVPLLRFTGVKAHLSCALTANGAHRKHQTWKCSGIRPFLWMKVVKNIFAWNDCKPKEIVEKGQTSPESLSEKGAPLWASVPIIYYTLEKILSKRGSRRKPGRKHNFSKFLTLADFSHNSFAIFPFRWLYELYKLYKYFIYLPL